MAGVLTVHSNGTGEFLSGHSWIEYKPDDGVAKTYGTWGNNPTGQGNGLFENLELGRTPDASRSMRINNAQEAQLLKVIGEYKGKGQDGWGYLSPARFSRPMPGRQPPARSWRTGQESSATFRR